MLIGMNDSGHPLPMAVKVSAPEAL